MQKRPNSLIRNTLRKQCINQKQRNLKELNNKTQGKEEISNAFLIEENPFQGSITKLKSSYEIKSKNKNDQLSHNNSDRLALEKKLKKIQQIHVNLNQEQSEPQTSLFQKEKQLFPKSDIDFSQTLLKVQDNSFQPSHLKDEVQIVDSEIQIKQNSFCEKKGSFIVSEFDMSRKIKSPVFSQHMDLLASGKELKSMQNYDNLHEVFNLRDYSQKTNGITSVYDQAQLSPKQFSEFSSLNFQSKDKAKEKLEKRSVPLGQLEMVKQKQQILITHLDKRHLKSKFFQNRKIEFKNSIISQLKVKQGLSIDSRNIQSKFQSGDKLFSFNLGPNQNQPKNLKQKDLETLQQIKQNFKINKIYFQQKEENIQMQQKQQVSNEFLIKQLKVSQERADYGIQNQYELQDSCSQSLIPSCQLTMIPTLKIKDNYQVIYMIPSENSPYLANLPNKGTSTRNINQTFYNTEQTEDHCIKIHLDHLKRKQPPALLDLQLINPQISTTQMSHHPDNLNTDDTARRGYASSKRIVPPSNAVDSLDSRFISQNKNVRVEEVQGDHLDQYFCQEGGISVEGRGTMQRGGSADQSCGVSGDGDLILNKQKNKQKTFVEQKKIIFGGGEFVDEQYIQKTTQRLSSSQGGGEVGSQIYKSDQDQFSIKSRLLMEEKISRQDGADKKIKVGDHIKLVTQFYKKTFSVGEDEVVQIKVKDIGDSDQKELKIPSKSSKIIRNNYDLFKLQGQTVQNIPLAIQGLQTFKNNNFIKLANIQKSSQSFNVPLSRQFVPSPTNFCQDENGILHPVYDLNNKHLRFKFGNDEITALENKEQKIDDKFGFKNIEVLIHQTRSNNITKRKTNSIAGTSTLFDPKSPKSDFDFDATFFTQSRLQALKELTSIESKLSLIMKDPLIFPQEINQLNDNIQQHDYDILRSSNNDSSNNYYNRISDTNNDKILQTSKQQKLLRLALRQYVFELTTQNSKYVKLQDSFNQNDYIINEKQLIGVQGHLKEVKSKKEVDDKHKTRLRFLKFIELLQQQENLMSKSNITNKEIERKTQNFRKKLQESFKVPNPFTKSLSPQTNSYKKQYKEKETFEQKQIPLFQRSASHSETDEVKEEAEQTQILIDSKNKDLVMQSLISQDLDHLVNPMTTVQTQSQLEQKQLDSPKLQKILLSDCKGIIHKRQYPQKLFQSIQSENNYAYLQSDILQKKVNKVKQNTFHRVFQNGKLIYKMNQHENKNLLTTNSRISFDKQSDIPELNLKSQTNWNRTIVVRDSKNKMKSYINSQINSPKNIDSRYTRFENRIDQHYLSQVNVIEDSVVQDNLYKLRESTHFQRHMNYVENKLVNPHKNKKYEFNSVFVSSSDIFEYKDNQSQKQNNFKSNKLSVNETSETPDIQGSQLSDPMEDLNVPKNQVPSELTQAILYRRKKNKSSMLGRENLQFKNQLDFSIKEKLTKKGIQKKLQEKNPLLYSMCDSMLGSIVKSNHKTQINTNKQINEQSCQKVFNQTMFRKSLPIRSEYSSIAGYGNKVGQTQGDNPMMMFDYQQILDRSKLNSVAQALRTRQTKQ